MVDKDFLSQFSGENKKPDSFKEEERVKVTKEKKPVNVKLIVIILAIVLAILGLVLFLIFRPTIEVRDFVGSNVSEVKAWIKQNDIETQGVIFREEYSFEYDEDYVISQSVDPDKKIRKNAKMDFVVSKGADPDELVSVPDIESMYKEELQDWIKENKLTKTKLMSVYSEDKEIGEVVSYEFKNCDADTFTRSSTLNINVSKGPQPAGTVIVDDFVKQDYSIAEAWAKKNKIELIKTTKYDDKIAKDLVVSQSVEPKKEMKQGESLTVVVSLGKGVKVPDFSTMSKDDVDDWTKENAAYCKVKNKYAGTDDYVIEQSMKTGAYIGEDSKLLLTLNLGKNFYLDEIGFTIVGNSYDKFKDYAKELEEKGLYIDTHRNYVDSDKPEGTILAINSIYDEDGNDYSEVQRLPLVVNVTCDISNGDLADLIRLPYEKFIEKDIETFKMWIVENHSYNLDVTYHCDEKNPEFDKYDYTVKEIKYYINDKETKDIKECDGYISKKTKLEVNLKEIPKKSDTDTTGD